jgi:hypothetical protein
MLTPNSLNDMRGVFLTRYISHEMRTPLSAAAMGLSLLEDDLSMEDEAGGPSDDSFLHRHGDVLRMVQTSFQKAEAICADLLQYDKFEDDNLPIYKQTFRAVELLHDIVDPFHVLARRAGVELKVNVYTNRHVPLADVLSGRDTHLGATEQQRERNREADTPLLEALVDADKPKLTQVVSNLLSNAFKFTPASGTVTVTLYVSNVLGAKAMHVVPWDDEYIEAATGAASHTGNIKTRPSAKHSSGRHSAAGDGPVLSVSQLRRHSEANGNGTSSGVKSLLQVKNATAVSLKAGARSAVDDNASAAASAKEMGSDHSQRGGPLRGPRKFKPRPAARGSVWKFLRSRRYCSCNAVAALPACSCLLLVLRARHSSLQVSATDPEQPVVTVPTFHVRRHGHRDETTESESIGGRRERVDRRRRVGGRRQAVPGGVCAGQRRGHREGGYSKDVQKHRAIQP